MTSMHLDSLVNFAFPEVRQRYGSRETILYALGVGACSDPLDLAQLRLVYEKELQALPSMACVLAHPGPWIRDPSLQINYVKLVHAEQHFSLHSALPAEGEVIAGHRIVGVLDKGVATGSLVYVEKTLHTPEGSLIGTVNSTYLLRGDGGCGNWGEPRRELSLAPTTAPSGTCEHRSLPIAALIYRLSGDSNPLHADPEIARKAGFDRPILHGLCTLGIACNSLVQALCEGNATRLRGMGARFTKPVFPGDTLRTEYWIGTDHTLQFRCMNVERNEVVLDRGTATLA
jgi:acyl dehydratase